MFAQLVIQSVKVIIGNREQSASGSVPAGSGHDCFLKGVVVQADITAPQYWWLQWQRYHFHDIISSESKMYGILKMNIDVQCNEYVDAPVKEYLKSLLAAWNNIDIYLDEKDKKICSSVLLPIRLWG